MNTRHSRGQRRIAANGEATGLAPERDQLLKRLQLQFECMPLGCVVSDPDFTIRDWNPAATAIIWLHERRGCRKELLRIDRPAFVPA
jgi:PAS domain-containing protein